MLLWIVCVCGMDGQGMYSGMYSTVSWRSRKLPVCSSCESSDLWMDFEFATANASRLLRSWAAVEAIIALFGFHRSKEQRKFDCIAMSFSAIFQHWYSADLFAKNLPLTRPRPLGCLFACVKQHCFLADWPNQIVLQNCTELLTATQYERHAMMTFASYVFAFNQMAEMWI